MPEMTLEWILKENGINPRKDTMIDTSVAFAAMSGSFISGNGDFVTLFEPNALKLEQEGYGYVVASLGELGGDVPYTVYNARKSYIEKNQETVKSFVKAIQKGLDFAHNHNSEEIAKVILDYFPDTSLNDLIKIIERYKSIDSWYKTTYITEKSYNHVLEIIDNAGELKNKPPYKDLVDNSFSN